LATELEIQATASATPSKVGQLATAITEETEEEARRSWSAGRGRGGGTGTRAAGVDLLAADGGSTASVLRGSILSWSGSTVSARRPVKRAQGSFRDLVTLCPVQFVPKIWFLVTLYPLQFVPKIWYK
jgi:hypothetical protein